MDVAPTICMAATNDGSTPPLTSCRQYNYLLLILDCRKKYTL